MMNAIATWYGDLAPRERRMMGALGAVAVLIVICLVPYLVGSSLQARRAEDEDLRVAIQRIEAGRAGVRSRQAKHAAVVARYERKAPKLGGFLDQLAKDEGLEVVDAQDKPDLPIGTSKRYTERTTSLRLRKVEGYPFLKFLEKVEQSGYPVAITRLSLHKKGGEHDAYDVELGVSAYDRSADAPAGANSASPTGSAAPGGGG